MSNKKYYWLKLKDDFFTSREIKKLRKIAGGDTYTIIYLKMQLLSIKKEGLLVYEGTESSLVEQLALELDEDEDNVKMTLAFLQANKLLEQITDDEYLLNRVPESLGSETSAAERMRKMREKKQNSIEKCNNVTPELQAVTKSYTEIERRDKRKEIEIEIEIEDEKTVEVLSKKDIDLIIKKWNDLQLQNLMSINPSTNRYTMLKARIKEFSLDDVIQAIDNISKSKFLKGQNDKGWTITFDWLVRPNNFIKVLEGNYNDKDIKKVDKVDNYKKTGFHNFDQNSDKYSKDDMEEIAKRKRMEMSKKMRGI